MYPQAVTNMVVYVTVPSDQRVFVLLAAVLGAVLSYDGFDQCSSYPEYNTLVNLIKQDECMNIDSVFKLLADISIKEHAGTCRNHVIYLLAEHFGPHARTPQYCQCQGTNMLQEYHMGPRDGVPDNRDTCLTSNAYYRNLYNQFFQSNHSHGVQACRTHHSLWNSLRNVETHDHGHVFSCLKDLIFHLKYAFQYHTDKCSCSSATVPSKTNGPQEHHGEHYYDHHCHQLDSFNKLQLLGDSDACLSANSVWHYLDNLQVISPKCRERIQKHMADKYRNATLQDGDACTCRERGQLVNNVTHRLNNGSTHGCKTASDDYIQVRTDLFSHNAANRCQNHNYLWNKLEHIQNYCGHYDRNNTCTRYVDCTQDLIVRGANHYPTDDSDGCVCEKKTAVITTPSKDPMTLTPSTTVTPPMASATSRKAAHVPTTIATTLSKFSCDKQATIEAIAKSIHVANSDSSPCGPSGNGSDDAYILSVCKITSPSTWKKGANVMSDCESATPVIPTYTPISTFTGDNYNPLGAQSGIFLGCSNNGIKMAIQKCNGVPIFIQVESGTFFENPRNYFVIN